MKSEILPARIEAIIVTIRGERVILDTDLAYIYGVSVSRLNEQVKRNADRFPDDFLIRLTKKEWPPPTSKIAKCDLKEGAGSA